MTDVFSKFTVVVPTWDQRAETVAQVLVGFENHLSVSLSCCSGGGSILISTEFLVQQLCSLYQVAKSHSTPYHLTSSGKCEMFNHTLHNFAYWKEEGMGILFSTDVFLL